MAETISVLAEVYLVIHLNNSKKELIMLEYAVLSNSGLRDLMRMYNRFHPYIPMEETQGSPAWKKIRGLYIKPMWSVYMFPMNNTLEYIDTIPTFFGPYPGLETGVMCLDLYRFIEPFLSTHALGGVFMVNSDILSVKVDYSGTGMKIKETAREIISFSRELTGREFGEMNSLRRIYDN